MLPNVEKDDAAAFHAITLQNPAREREKDLLKIQQERERENLKKHKRAEKEAGRHESERRANVYIRNEKRVHIYIQ